MNCPECDKEYESEAQLKIHRYLDHKVEDDDLAVTDEPPLTGPTDDDETAPYSESAPRKTRVRDKLRSRVTSSAVAKRRESGAGLLSLGWSGIGTMLVRTGVDVPVGQTLQFQADVAGEILDGLIARTFLDRLLQPMVTNYSALEEVGSLLMLPVLVGMYERNPDASPMLEPLLRQAVMQNITTMGPLIKKKRVEEAKFAKAVRDLDLGLPDDMDPVAAVLASIFAPPPGMEAMADA